MFSRRKLLPLAALLPLACANPLEMDNRSQLVVADVGERVDVTLGNVGPAEWDSPPSISSDVLTFLGVDYPLPHTPGGVTQRFRFKAETRGVAMVIFRKTYDSGLVGFVVDTIMVR
jgi:hypothetical protein